MKSTFSLIALVILIVGCTKDPFQECMKKIEKNMRESHRILDEINIQPVRPVAQQSKHGAGSEIYKEHFGKYPDE